MTLRTAGVAILYFACVVGAGFVLGPIRLLVLAPRVGERAAELIEMPIMLAVIWLAARWIARGPGRDLRPPERLKVGIGAVALIVLAEAGVGVALRGMTLAQAFLERDPVSGLAYYASLAVCTVAPWLAGRRLGGRLGRGTR